MPTPEKPDLREMVRDALLSALEQAPGPTMRSNIDIYADAAMNALAEYLARPDVVQTVFEEYDSQRYGGNRTSGMEAMRAALARLAVPPAAG